MLDENYIIIRKAQELGEEVAFVVEIISFGFKDSEFFREGVSIVITAEEVVTWQNLEERGMPKTLQGFKEYCHDVYTKKHICIHESLFE